MIKGSTPVTLADPAQEKAKDEVQRKRKHLLDLKDWTKEEVEALFNTADVMAQVMERTIKKVPALQGFTVGTLFFENSTRTKLSFERAARAQSADVMSFAAGATQPC